MIERLRRSRPGRVQMLPHAYSVISSWKSRVRSVVPAIARSTCSSPSTSRRTFIPSDISSASSGPSTCRTDQGGDLVGALGRREVRGVRQLHQRTTAYADGDGLEVLAGRDGVVRAGDRQDGRPDLAEPVADVEPGQCLADPDVAEVVRVLERVQQARHGVGRAVREARGEPALDGPADQDRRAGGADLADPVRPHGVVADPRAGAQQHRGRRPGRGASSRSWRPTQPPTESPA